MFDRIKKHIEERDAIIQELEKIMGYCDDSPVFIDFIDSAWEIQDGELHLQVKDFSLEEDYYEYTISSLGAEGETFFMGELDGYTYVMAYEYDWEEAQIFILKTENQENV